jgi:hypothetical protein
LSAGLGEDESSCVSSSSVHATVKTKGNEDYKLKKLTVAASFDDEIQLWTCVSNVDIQMLESEIEHIESCNAT